MRIGEGYDVHRLKEGRKMILGGVEIPCTFGPDGHSDADVLLHAVMDAILGAMAAEDIGSHFPDNDPAYKGISSMLLLEKVAALLREKGLRLVNLDSTVALQRPKLRPHIDAMRANIAHVLEVSVDCVSVKATTEEGMGFTGSGEGISARAVVLLDTI